MSANVIESENTGISTSVPSVKKGEKENLENQKTTDDWTIVRGKRKPDRASLDTIRVEATKAITERRAIKLRLRNLKKFCFRPHVMNNVTRLIKIGDKDMKQTIGTLKVNDAPFIKTETRFEACWLRKKTGDKTDICTYVIKDRKTKHGTIVYDAHWTLCKLHSKSKSETSRNECREAMKTATEHVNILLKEIEEKRKIVVQDIVLKARDNFEKELATWNVDDLVEAVEAFFIEGLCLFKEVRIVDPNFVLPGAVIEEGKYPHWTTTYPETDTNFTIRVWHCAIHALQFLAWSVHKVRIFIPFRKLVQTLAGIRIGHEFVLALLEDIRLFMEKGFNPSLTYTMSYESWAEGGPTLIVDHRVHLDKVKTIQRYTERDLWKWGDVVLGSEDLKIYFRKACLERLQTILRKDSYIIHPGADNKKFTVLWQGDSWTAIKVAIKRFVEWRAEHPQIRFNFLGYMGEFIYIQRGVPFVDSFALRRYVFPTTGGGVEPVAEFIYPKGGTDKAATPVKTNPAPAGDKKNANNKKDRQKKNAPVKYQVPAKQYVPKTDAPSPAKETSSTQTVKNTGTRDPFVEIKGLKYYTDKIESGFMPKISGSGWCGMDTISYFLEEQYPSIFNGVPLIYKREFVVFYARLCSDYSYAPDFTQALLDSGKWMDTATVVQTLHALGFNATMYEAQDQEVSRHKLRFVPTLTCPYYKDTKEGYIASVFYNGAHFEPLVFNKIKQHIDEGPRTIVMDDYLLTGGEKFRAGETWTLSPKAKELLCVFLATVQDCTHSFKYLARKQMALCASWSFSARGMVQIYPYEDIKDNEYRDLMTRKPHSIEQSYAMTKARFVDKYEAIINTPDFHKKFTIPEEKKECIEKLEEGEVYQVKDFRGLKFIQVASPEYAERQWKDIITSLIMSNAPPSCDNLIKTPETKEQSETRFLTEEEVEQKFLKFHEEQEAAQQLKREENENAIKTFKEEVDKNFLKQVKEQEEEIAKLSETAKLANENLIKTNTQIKEEVEIMRKLIADMEVELKVQTKLKEKLEKDNKETKGLLKTIIDWILTCLGFQKRKGFGAGKWNHYWDGFEHYADKAKTKAKETASFAAKFTKEKAGDTAGYTSSMYNSDFVKKVRKAVPNPKQIAGATYNGTKKGLSFVKDKAGKGLNYVEQHADANLEFGVSFKQGKFRFNYASAAQVGQYVFDTVASMRTGLSRCDSVVGFRARREVAFEYDHKHKSLVTSLNVDERYSFGKFAFDFGATTYAGIHKGPYVLRQVDYIRLLEKYRTQFHREPMTFLRYCQSFKTPETRKGGGYVKRSITNLIINAALGFIGHNHWSNLALPATASLVKIPSGIPKPFSYNFPESDMITTSSDCILMRNYLGNVVLADFWREEGPDKMLVTLNKACANSAVAPRLPAFAKTLVNPDFRLMTHHFWCRTRLDPTMNAIRQLLILLRTPENVPSILVTLASSFLPFKYSLPLVVYRALLPLIDLMIFKIDYTLAVHRHMVSFGVISQISPKVPLLTNCSPSLLSACRDAMQTHCNTWYNNMRLTNVSQAAASQLSRVLNCQGEWTASTAVYSVALFDNAASSSNAMQRSYK